MNQQHWKGKVHKFVNNCQNELKRTTEIGKKMLSASKTSTTLRDAYEELGQILEKEIENGNHSIQNPKVMDLLAVVKACKNDLNHLEGEMNRIRFSPAPDMMATGNRTNIKSSKTEDKNSVDITSEVSKTNEKKDS